MLHSSHTHSARLSPGSTTPELPSERATEQARLLDVIRRPPSDEPGHFTRRMNAALDLRLCQLPETTLALTELLGSQDDSLVFLGACALAQTRDPAARALLCEIACDDSREASTRERALESLGRAVTLEETTRFVELLVAPRSGPEMVTLAADGLRERIHDHELVDRVLTAWMKDTSNIQYVQALAGSQNERAISALAQIAGATNVAVKLRDEAAMGVALSTAACAVNVLRELFQRDPAYALRFIRGHELFLPPTRAMVTALRSLISPSEALNPRLGLATKLADSARASLDRLQQIAAQRGVDMHMAF